MSPYAQRVAIATYIGWEIIPTETISARGHLTAIFGRKTGFVPDYLNDLNAIIHACRETITDADYGMFEHQMLDVLERDNQEDQCRYYFGSAAQYSEALLKTLSLWDDSK